MSIEALLRNIYSKERVFFDSDSLNRYGTCTLPRIKKGQAVVFPINDDEVSRTVRLANEIKTPIYYFSTGKNWGYGTSQPIDENSIIMILEKMNRICEFNAELGYVVIEPGVTQKQLFDFLQQQEKKYWMDCTDSTPAASVLGNALERGVGYTYYGDHFGNLCGLEVVLADGSVIKSDSLCGDSSKTFHTYKWGTGPYLEGLFSQSNFGIVVRAGLWLMPEPEFHLYYIAELADPSGFEKYVDTFRDLAMNRIISNTHIFNSYIVSFGYEKFPLEIQSQLKLSDDYLRSQYQKWGIRPWTALGAIYGSTEQVRACQKKMKKSFGRGVKLNFLSRTQLDGLKQIRPYTNRTWVYKTLNFFTQAILKKDFKQIAFLPELFTFQRGEPGEFLISKAYYKNRRSKNDSQLNPALDGCGLFWLAPIVPAVGLEIKSFLQILSAEYDKFQSNPAMSLIQVNPRTMIVAIFIVYDKESAADTEKAERLYFHLAQKVQDLKYQHYRTSVIYMDRILQSGSGAQIITEKIKPVLDPNCILAPGRYGPRN